MTLDMSTRLLAGVLFSTLFLAACTTAPQTRALMADTPPGLPPAIELTATPFYPQQQYQCGPAALATVLAAHAVRVTPEELVDAVYVPALHGSLPEEITATARRYQMLAYPLSSSLQALLTEVAHGNPILVMQNLGTDWFQNWHFAVVVGFDLEKQQLILRSGTRKRWHTSLATFERTWSRSDYWALVILPAGKIPASARLGPYLQAAHDLEAAARTDAALSAYQAATRYWPNEPHAWMTYGNSVFGRGDHIAASAAFLQVTRLTPDDARGWNNLAYALLQGGCPQQARHAAGCAVKFGADDNNYKDTLAEIEQLAQGTDQPRCLAVTCEQ
jgi:tetratricopeptide (TPR) repeat protein